MSIPVIDPFGAAADPGMPSLAPALNPAEVERQFGHGLPRLSGKHGFVRLRSIRVTRHKPGRRCVIEYDVEVEKPGLAAEQVTLLGKVRAGHSAKTGYRLLSAFWDAGFRCDSPDGISVPEAIGVVSEFRMWLQRKVPGRNTTHLLGATDGAAVVWQIAEAAHKLHLAGVPTRRRHTMADELQILRERLASVIRTEPRWAGRIARLLDASERLGAATPDPVPQGIHRDFYPDQVIMDGSRLYLTDFDLYCEGDPSLDIGNFLGHITEHSLRTMGNPGTLGDLERAMEERFVELSGEATRVAVRAYAKLTLMRHIHLSTLFPERRSFTRSLLELCEERVGIAPRILV